jgi:hypothetical protein
MLLRSCRANYAVLRQKNIPSPNRAPPAGNQLNSCALAMPPRAKSATRSCLTLLECRPGALVVLPLVLARVSQRLPTGPRARSIATLSKNCPRYHDTPGSGGCGSRPVVCSPHNVSRCWYLRRRPAASPPNNDPPAARNGRSKHLSLNFATLLLKNADAPPARNLYHASPPPRAARARGGRILKLEIPENSAPPRCS